MIKSADRLEGIEEYYFSKKLKEITQLNKEGQDIINLGIGSPDLPPHQSVIEALRTTALEEGVNGYQGYRGIPELRNEIAAFYKDKYQVSINPESEILPLIGSKEGIMHLSMTYLQNGDEVLVPDPGYPAYSACAKVSGAKLRYYKLEAKNQWLPDLDKLSTQDLSKVKLMWVNYPHMPTGAKGSTELFNKLKAFGELHHILICNDNPYSFILNDKPQSILKAGASDYLIELNSLSKSHNLAGWRVGMLIGASHHIDNVMKFKSNMDSGIYKPIQMAALQALKLGDSWYNQLNNIYRERQEIAFQMLTFLNCEFDSNQTGMFVWGKCSDAYNEAENLTEEILRNTHVFITPGFIFGENGINYIRISLCADIQMLKRALERIKNWKR